MSASSGYVHVSRRTIAGGSAVSASDGRGRDDTDAPGSESQRPGESRHGESRHGEPVHVGQVAGPYGSAHFGHDVVLSAPLAVVTPSAAGQTSEDAPDSAARGFVIYVGLTEEAAHDAGTSLARLAQQTRSFIHQRIPRAQTHAAVALAPQDTGRSDLDVVRQALGDPTAAPKHAAPARPRRTEAGDMSARRKKLLASNGVLIDMARREVFLDGQRLGLTFKEFELLFFLVENSSRAVSREELITALWADDSEIPHERTIDVHIRRLRAKLGRLSNAVRTVRGEGYRFYDHPEVLVWTAPEYLI